MLPRAARLHESADFRRVTRSGVRAGRATLVIHAAPGLAPHSRVGLVVSKAVGGAVARNRVKRQLRHLASAALSTDLAASAATQDVVVRALPASATRPDRLGSDLVSAWAQVSDRLSPQITRVSS